MTIFNNLLFDNNRGVQLNGASGVSILSNTIADNDARGISIVASPNVVVRNNILQDNSNRNVDIDDSASVDSYDGDFNLIFSTQRNTDPEDTVAPSTIIGENDFFADALFLIPERGFYRLRAQSPAVDAGGNLDNSLLQALFTRSATETGAPDSPPVDLGYHFPATEE